MDLSVKKMQNAENMFCFKTIVSTKNSQENTDTVQENSPRHVRPTNDALVLLTKPAPNVLDHLFKEHGSYNFLKIG